MDTFPSSRVLPATGAWGWRVRLCGCFLALALALALPVLVPGVALAHERRQVGPYTFIVGFLNEPAIEGQPNSIDLRISDAATGQPVEGADKVLKAAVAAGGGSAKEMPLTARFGQAGAYNAFFIPTKSGSYSFTFTGAIGGQPINEKFESGPGRFGDVEAAQTLQFPVTMPSGAALDASLKQAQARADLAQSQSRTALWVGVAGVVVGAIGLGVGLWALAAARRTSQAAKGAEISGSSSTAARRA